MSNIINYWKTIEDFLKITDINIFNSLSKPANEDDIKELENIIKVNLPDSFKESLLIHNGQDETENGITFVDSQKLLSINEMCKIYKELCFYFQENKTMEFMKKPYQCEYLKRNYLYNPKWLKFTKSYLSKLDGLIIDFDPAEKGTAGQIFFRPESGIPEDKIITKSYENWLERLCMLIENNEYKIKNGKIIYGSLKII